MAFQAKKIFPIDLQPRVAVGVDIPFSADAVFNSTYETKDALKANLINYFLTNKGERYLNPDFGSNIKEQLFNNMTEERLDIIEGMVANDIDLFFPAIQPLKIDIIDSPDTNTITLYLNYSIRNTYIEDELVINFEQ